MGTEMNSMMVSGESVSLNLDHRFPPVDATPKRCKGCGHFRTEHVVKPLRFQWESKCEATGCGCAGFVMPEAAAPR